MPEHDYSRPALEGMTDGFPSGERFAGLLSSSDPDTSDAPPEPVRVIPLGETDNWTLRVPAPSAVRAATSRFSRRAPAGVTLSPTSLELLFLAALDPGGLADEKVKRQRVEHGWLLRIDDVRLYTPLVNLSCSNDRLLAEAVYAADPAFAQGTSGLAAVPMPVSHPEHASLVYAGDRALLREASDLNMERVAQSNPVDVGARIIEQPITLTAAALATGLDASGRPVPEPDAATTEEFEAVDGNSRLAKAFGHLKFPVRLLPQRLHGLYGTDQLVTLRPSLLQQLTGEDRRDLTRKMLKFYGDAYDALAQRLAARGRLTEVDQRAKDAAAAALNSMTVPATIIVGYVDDEAGYGNARFATAVREVLQGMNVAPRPFDEGARSGVAAEQAVVALHEAQLLGPDSATEAVAAATRDILIGRAPAAQTLGRLGLTVAADLRAAVVVRELTRPGPAVTRRLRGPLNARQVHLKHRAAAVVELLLRGYSASRGPQDIESIRRVLSSGSGGCLWQGLVTTSWEVADVATDAHVDELAELALEQCRAAPDPPQGALCLLGVLGSTALVTGGYLLPAGGSGEYVAGRLEGAPDRVPIHRGSVGSVVEKLLQRDWGIRLLADAVKRSRAGLPPRVVDPATGEFAEPPQEERTARVNAAIRRMLMTDKEPGVGEPTDTDRRSRAFVAFSEAVSYAKDRLQDLLALYAESPDQMISHETAEATLTNLRRIEGHFRAVVALEPLDSW